MAASISGSRAQDRLTSLLEFLAHDPGNKSLIIDAAEAALDNHNLDQAATLLGQLDAADIAEARAGNLAGLIALRQGRSAEAVAIFSALFEQNSATGLRLNLAWAYLLARDYSSVLDTLEEEALASEPLVLWLRVQALHHLGRLDEALAVGDHLVADGLDDSAVFGALSAVALDASDMARGRTYALRASDQPDGAATLGMLALYEGDAAAAEALFDKALSRQPGHARAMIGRGLVLLQSDPSQAAGGLERGAEILGNHLGSWIAAGWAHFTAGDMSAARRDFERARSLDDTFSEVHGGLAVIAILEGDLEGAREQMRVALRLDGQSLGGRLAQIMLLEQAGKPEAAAAILRNALEAPLGPDGRTLQQSLAGFIRARS